jgi:flagellar assembly protein FliH
MTATKFTFDTEFIGKNDIAADSARGRRRRTVTEDEVERLCAEAKSEGMKAGEVRALEAIAASAQEAANAVAKALAQMTSERQSMLGESANLAFVLARKLAHAALAAFPQAEVEEALREAMHQAMGEPRIALKAAPEVAEAIAPRIAEIAHEEAYEGRVQVAADPSLKRADCRIEWRGGGAERAETTLENALQDLITRNFSDVAKNDQGAGNGK